MVLIHLLYLYSCSEQEVKSHYQSVKTMYGPRYKESESDHAAVRMPGILVYTIDNNNLYCPIKSTEVNLNYINFFS